METVPVEKSFLEKLLQSFKDENNKNLAYLEREKVPSDKNGLQITQIFERFHTLKKDFSTLLKYEKLVYKKDSAKTVETQDAISKIDRELKNEDKQLKKTADFYEKFIDKYASEGQETNPYVKDAQQELPIIYKRLEQLKKKED